MTSLLALKQLTDYISCVPFLSLVKSCQDAFEAMKVLADEEIDLIFCGYQYARFEWTGFYPLFNQPSDGGLYYSLF
mgnify:CR=1 FL=1